MITPIISAAFTSQWHFMPGNTFLMVFFTWKRKTASVKNQIVQLPVDILSVNEEKHPVGTA